MFRYRVFISILCALAVYALGYVIDIRGLNEQHAELIANEIELHQMQLNLASDMPKHTAVINDENDLMQPFLNLTGFSKVTLETFKRLDEQNYQVSIVANYSDVLHFFQMLSADATQYALQKMTIKLIDNGNLKLDFELSIGSVTNQNKSLHGMTNIVNPFCDNDWMAVDRQTNQTTLDAYALNEMTMLGTISAAGKLSALIMFPNGVTKEVNAHMKLGKEQGVIKTVTPTSIKLDLPSHQAYQLNSG